MMEQWLIRTAKNWIAGPYSKEQVCKMILEGSLGLQDEVCPANGYWILLHERKEVLEQLGVEVPRILSKDVEDVTESEILVKPEELKQQPLTSETKPIVASIPLTRSEPEEIEVPQSSRALSFIFLGAGLLLIIALRVFKH